MSPSELAPLAVAVPLAVAAGLAAVGRRLPRRAVDVAALAAAAAVVAIAAVLVHATGSERVVTWLGGWRPVHGTSVGVSFTVDRIGAGAVLLVAALMLVALVFSARYFADAASGFHTLMLAFLAGMVAFALTGDLFDMFVFFELMSTAAYALTGFKVEERTALQGAVNFGVVNSLGAYCTLLGVGFVYARTGELNLAAIGTRLHGSPPDALLVAAFVLVATGWFVKAAVVPFHFWLADAHAVAPAPVCLLFSGVMVELGLYGVLRVWSTAFAGVVPADVLRRTLLVVGVLTVVVGSVMCLLQHHLKRLLAYSTIAHVGMFACGAAALDRDAVGGTALYVVGHGAVKGALFLGCGVLLNRCGSVDELTLRGRGRELWGLGLAWLLCALALAGLPPFATFTGKAVAEHALVEAGYPWVPWLFVAGSALTAGAALRAGARVFLGAGDAGAAATGGASAAAGGGGGGGDDEEPETEHGRLAATPWNMTAAIAALVAAALVAGVWPGLVQRASDAGAQFLAGTDYARSALRGLPSARVRPATVTAWTGSGVGFAALSTVLALAVAGLGLWWRALGAVAARVARAGRPALAVVRRVHSGHVGDYVAWLLAGVVLLAALVGLPLR